MAEKLEISIEIIAHATEDVEKILESFSEEFDVAQEQFSKNNLTGHFENPITLLKAKIKKNDAKKFLEKLVSKIPQDQFSQIINDIETHLQDSILHLRFGKQDMIQGKVNIQEKDAIKFKIFTPIYIKADIAKNYVELLTAAR